MLRVHTRRESYGKQPNMTTFYKLNRQSWGSTRNTAAKPAEKSNAFLAQRTHTRKHIIFGPGTINLHAVNTVNPRHQTYGNRTGTANTTMASHPLPCNWMDESSAEVLVIQAGQRKQTSKNKQAKNMFCVLSSPLSCSHYRAQTMVFRWGNSAFVDNHTTGNH